MLANNPNLGPNFFVNAGQPDSITLNNLSAISPAELVIALSGAALNTQSDFIDANWNDLSEAQRDAILTSAVSVNLGTGVLNESITSAQARLLPTVFWQQVTTPQLRALLANTNGLFTNFLQNSDQPNHMTVANLQAIPNEVLIELELSAIPAANFQPLLNANWTFFSATQRAALAGIPGFIPPNVQFGSSGNSLLIYQQPSSSTSHLAGNALVLADNNITGSRENFYLDSSNQTLNDYDVQALQLIQAMSRAPLYAGSSNMTLTDSLINSIGLRSPLTVSSSSI
jgi:hypothetical protein